jgi:hypothetical protein
MDVPLFLYQGFGKGRQLAIWGQVDKLGVNLYDLFIIRLLLSSGPEASALSFKILTPKFLYPGIKVILHNQL